MLKNLRANRRVLLVVVGGAGVIVAGSIAIAIISAKATDPVTTPARSRYMQALYTVEFPTEWKLTLDDEPTDRHLESIWRDPTKPGTAVLIYNEIRPLPIPPLVRAQLARAATEQPPRRRGESLAPVRLGDQPAARWIFDVGNDRRVVYFTDQCDVDVEVIASAPQGEFHLLARTFHEIASSVDVRCP